MVSSSNINYHLSLLEFNPFVQGGISTSYSKRIQVNFAIRVNKVLSAHVTYITSASPYSSEQVHNVTNTGMYIGDDDCNKYYLVIAI